MVNNKSDRPQMHRGAGASYERQSGAQSGPRRDVYADITDAVFEEITKARDPKNNSFEDEGGPGQQPANMKATRVSRVTPASPAPNVDEIADALRQYTSDTITSEAIEHENDVPGAQNPDAQSQPRATMDYARPERKHVIQNNIPENTAADQGAAGYNWSDEDLQALNRQSGLFADEARHSGSSAPEFNSRPDSSASSQSSPFSGHGHQSEQGRAFTPPYDLTLQPQEYRAIDVDASEQNTGPQHSAPLPTPPVQPAQPRPDFLSNINIPLGARPPLGGSNPFSAHPFSAQGTLAPKGFTPNLTQENPELSPEPAPDLASAAPPPNVKPPFLPPHSLPPQMASQKPLGAPVTMAQQRFLQPPQAHIASQPAHGAPQPQGEQQARFVRNDMASGPPNLGRANAQRQNRQRQHTQEGGWASKKLHKAKQRKPKNYNGDEDGKRRGIATYFGKKSLWTFFIMLIGLVLIFNPARYHPLYGYELQIDLAFAIGAVLLGCGIVLRYFMFKAPSDELVDKWTMEDLRQLENRAIELMDITRRDLITDPITLIGFPNLDIIGNAYRNSKYGRDHVLRYTPRAITVLCLSENEIYGYEGAVDLTTGSRVYERVSEFFYRDITVTGLSKITVPQTWRSMTRWFKIFQPWRWSFIDRVNMLLTGRSGETGSQRNTKEVFRIGLFDGAEIVTVLRDGRLSGEREYDEIPITVDDKVIHLIREFIRARKTEQLSPNMASAPPENVDPMTSRAMRLAALKQI